MISLKLGVKGHIIAVLLAPFGFIPNFLLSWVGLDSRTILYGSNVITSTENLLCTSIDSLFSVLILSGIYAIPLKLIYGSTKKILTFGVIYLWVYQFFHLAFLLSDTVIVWKETIENGLHYFNLYSFDEYTDDYVVESQKNVRDMILMLTFFIANSSLSMLIARGAIQLCCIGGSRTR